MKKPVLPRMLGLLVLYCTVFMVLVMIQFTKKGNFTRRIGSMVVSGQYRTAGEDEAPPADGLLLDGGVRLYFGGLEFSLKNKDGNEGLALIDAKGGRQAALPELMRLSGDTARFTLSGGTELAFTTMYSGGSPELRISGVFAEDVSGLDIPFKPYRSSVIRESPDGQFTILSEGAYYQFARSVQLQDEGRLSLNADNAAVSYRAKPRQTGFNPADFIISQARTAQSFNDALGRWTDQSFSLWNRNISIQNDEDSVIAYSGESIRRGNYKAAAAAVSPAFLSGANRTYESSVYLGSMESALRSFTAAEREKISRISRLINEKSPNLLKEAHVFEFLWVRGFVNFVDEGIELIRSIEPSLLTADLSPGVLEGYMDLKQWRPNADNPFERLTNQACHLLSEGIQKDEDRVFIFRDGTADIEFNLRMGRALWRWAEVAGNGDWAALGRSLVLSVLALRDSSGTAPAALLLSEEGKLSEAPDKRLSPARLYRLLKPGEYYPHAAAIGSGVNGIWAWTAASAVSAIQENNVLDISVSFPMNETHYMMIRGVRPFTKIQLYNMDYRTDPQFERYDSSGWVYSSQDQILVLKMKHRVSTEHIRIFY